MAAQFFGGFVGNAIVFASLGGALLQKDELRGIKPGDAASLGTAAGFTDYFPAEYVGPLGAFAIEALGPGILMFMILALTDERNPSRPSPGMAPFFVGMTVTVLISLFAPLTMAGWNPARDFPPRIIALLVGYGHLAIPGPHGGFWAYLFGPCFGAPIGGLIYDYLIAPGLPHASEEQASIEAKITDHDRAVLPNLLQMHEIVSNKVVSEPSCDVVVSYV
jgi:glycerol uptake facilitator-like aquaporin